MHRLALLTLAVLLPVASHAGAPFEPGDILVSDSLARLLQFPAVPAGAVIKVDPVTGTQSFVFLEEPFSVPLGIALDSQHRILLTEIGYFGGAAIVRLDPGTGIRETLCTDGSWSDVAISADREIFVVNPDKGSLVQCEPETGQTPTVSEGQNFVEPVGLAIEPDGNFLVTNSTALGGQIIRVLSQSGAQSVLASGEPLVNPAGIVVDRACGTYLTDLGTQGSTGKVLSLDRANGNLTVVCEGPPLVDPLGIAVEPNCNLLIANFDLSSDPSNLGSRTSEIIRCYTSTSAPGGSAPGVMSVVTSRDLLLFPYDVAVVPQPDGFALRLAALLAVGILATRRPAP